MHKSVKSLKQKLGENKKQEEQKNLTKKQTSQMKGNIRTCPNIFSKPLSAPLLRFYTSRNINSMTII